MASSWRVGVGIIGAGMISNEYLANLTSFPDLDVRAVGDLLPERAAAQAETYGVPASGTPAVVLADPAVEVIINLTVPAVHAEVSRSALEAGKHVWTEKPLALHRDDGRALIELGRSKGLRIGSATDTFLGGGLQNAQRLLLEGVIGRPVSVITMMQDPGPESWHPDPAFLFDRGAGPLWDRGPYYLSMLAQLFGSTDRVMSQTSTAFAQRTAGAGHRAGATFDVNVPTNVGVLTRFQSGVVAQSTYSFESSVFRAGWIEVSGTEGTLALPDPNHYVGDAYVNRFRPWRLEQLIAGEHEVTTDRSTWEHHPARTTTATRGVGVLEMARAIRNGVPHRASAELGFHVLDVMTAIDESAARGEAIRVESTVPTIEALPDSWDPFESTLG